MATFPNIFDRWMTNGSLAETTAHSTRALSDAHKLRSLPNEDVYFYAKRIDNSRVVRQADPRARTRDFRIVSGAGIAVLMMIGVLLPSAYGLMAGYQLSALKQENEKLAAERMQFDLHIARLENPERLQELAARQDFVAPAQSNTIYLENKSDKSLALNRR